MSPVWDFARAYTPTWQHVYPGERLSLEPGGPRVLILWVPWISRTTPGAPTHLRGGPDGKASSTRLGTHSGSKASHAAPHQPRPHTQPRLSTVKAAWSRSVRRRSTPGAGLRAQRASQLALRAAFQTALRGLPVALFGWRESAAGVR